jgi:hypothetical protein
MKSHQERLYFAPIEQQGCAREAGSWATRGLSTPLRFGRDDGYAVKFPCMMGEVVGV